MAYRSAFAAAALTCMCYVVLTAGLADGAAASPPQPDPVRMWAQRSASSATMAPAPAGEATSAEELAKKLANPISSLITASGEKGVLELMAMTHTGMTTDEFAKIVADWTAAAQHPRFKRPYIELVYQPMLELLAYLRAHGFKTFIVSGGGVEFMRVFAEKVYGIPPEQVVGSSGVLEFQMGQDGKPVLMRLPKVDFIDDKAGKPMDIQKFIGRRPILAFGNSDGDHQMLQWTAAGSVRFIGLVHHTDAEREWAYDRTSHVGQLDKALDEAFAKGWTVVSMKDDWRTIFPPATGR